MEATVAERVADHPAQSRPGCLGLTRATVLKVEIEGGRVVLRKNVDDAIAKHRGRFKFAEGHTSTDEVMRVCGCARATTQPPGRRE